ncbi:MAG TPA: AraC family transcriptional regulator [Longimicrobiales bacterium]|nr:AraC family transcriptional regulator [Longimicrobiales bacterium]
MQERTDVSNADPTSSGWRARWYLWDGGFLTMGRSSGVVPRHSHHAVQIAVGLDGPVGLHGPDESRVTAPGIIVAPDVPHQFAAMGSLLAMIFVDPESHEGRWLQRSLRAPVSEIPQAKLDACQPALRSIWDDPVDAPDTARLIHSVVRQLCAGPPPLRQLDPRIIKGLEVIRRMDTAKITLDAVAGAVFLSPSRFAHLFSEEVGLPFRRYVLWRRMTRAMLAVGRGSTLSAAAHACGFADSAHLTRTCHQMLGQAPSALLGMGEFYEIPAPFEMPFTAA